MKRSLAVYRRGNGMRLMSMSLRDEMLPHFKHNLIITVKYTRTGEFMDMTKNLIFPVMLKRKAAISLFQVLLFVQNLLSLVVFNGALFKFACTL